jgi:geranylgeranyl pyrophosphate synthase
MRSAKPSLSRQRDAFTPKNSPNISARAHFGRCSETTDRVWPLIIDALKDALHAPGPGDAMQGVFGHLAIQIEKRDPAVRIGPERWHKPALLRPYLARCAYEIGKGQDWWAIAPALAAVELHNISTYQSNLAFDNKIDWPSCHTSPSGQVMASMLSMTAAHICLEKLRGHSSWEEAVTRSHEWIQRCNGDVYLGQYLDLDVLRWSETLPEEHAFLDHYLRRCRLLGGSTFATALVGHWFSPNTHNSALFAALLLFFRALGTATQITNDLGDYCYSADRPYTSPFADLLNQRLTFPTYILARDGFPPVLEILRAGGPRDERLLRACSERLRMLEVHGAVTELLRTRIWPDVQKAWTDLLDSGCSEADLVCLTFAEAFVFRCKYMRFFET